MPLIKYTIYKTISKTIRTINSRDFYLFSIFSKAFQDICHFLWEKKLHKFQTILPPHTYTLKLKSYHGPKSCTLVANLTTF